MATNTEELIKEDKQYIWHPFTPLVGEEDPILIEKASGIYLYTKDGRQIIDAISSWWVNIHGHCNPVIAEAICKQANQAEHIIFAGFSHEPAINLAKGLLSILPDTMAKVFYSDNGSTAVEVALKMALQYWHNTGTPKKKIIAIEGSYHGDTFGSMAVAERGPFSAPFHEHLFDVDFIEFPTKENFESVKDKLAQLSGHKDVVAFIYEPLVQGAAGMRMYQPNQLDELMTIARNNKVLCIADEVMTGFGRTGKYFASLYLKNQPDIICISKGITGGFMPLAATCCNARVLKAFETDQILKTFFHGHSYTANPISCAAANASLSLLVDPSCQANIDRISAKHESFLASLNSEKIKDKRQQGTILAIEFKDREATSYLNPLRRVIYTYFLSKNILLRPLGNIIYIIPPYIISNDELDHIYNNINEFIESL